MENKENSESRLQTLLIKDWFSEQPGSIITKKVCILSMTRHCFIIYTLGMAQFSFKRHHDANILNDKRVVCTVKCWRHGCNLRLIVSGCNHVVFNVKLGHAALILNRLLSLCLCLCLCSELAKSLFWIFAGTIIRVGIFKRFTWFWLSPK